MGQTPVHLYDPINDYVTAELCKRFDALTQVCSKTNNVIDLPNFHHPTLFEYGPVPLT
jgi:hypothetical protein